MATRIPAESVGARDLHGLRRADLLEMYRTMLTSRSIDDREESMKRQNTAFFQLSAAGHEAIQVATARHLRPGSDWVYFYYRDRPFALALGVPPLQHFLQSVAADADPSSRGRQMPSHFSDPALRIVSVSSPTGTQYLQAVGTAEGAYRGRRIPGVRDLVRDFEEDEVVVVCSGDGTTSEGEFWEALNTACSLKLPVVFLVEDNGYAISVPVEVQTPGGSISRLVRGFPDLFVVECDGTDLIDAYEKSGAAIRYCREGRGPTLVHAHTVRLRPHSMSDDDRGYRSAAERAEMSLRDPLLRTRSLLIEEGIADEGELDAIETEIAETISEVADQALAYPQPDPATATRWLYSERVDPTSDEFDTEDRPEYEGTREVTMLDLLNRCFADEMERDPRVLCFGQDVADASREEILDEVPGKGGVFKVTLGLQRRFGEHRVFNSPVAEANILGRAYGLAIRGYKPVVEIQFFDYIWPGFHQIRNEIATIRYRSGNGWCAPMVIRAPYGGYLKGGSIYHSQTGASTFAHIPGLRVILPSSAEDAAGLLRTAIRCDDPVIFLEHKHLYRQIHNKGRYPGKEFMIPFGKAKVVRPGADLTVVTCGALVKRSLDAARIAAEHHGIDVEVLDIRSINPLDMERIADSVRKTGRVIVAHEDALSWGIGAEISARIADELFPWLDGPVKRVAAKDVWVAYSPQLEEAILPQVGNVLDAIVELAAY
ncbi:MAG: dehydrogenase [Gemmatimonadetes bacterium]|nr:dehydrogenase [Gemmatimonadota bacterium]